MSLSLILMVSMSVPALSADGGGEATASGGDAEKETKNDPEYSRKNSELNTLEVRIKERRKTVQDLIQRKQNEPDDEKKREYIQQMLTEHKQLNKEVARYEELRSELKYRFPDKGHITERRYISLKQQTLEEIEGEIGLDEVLTRFQMNVYSKYQIFREAYQRAEEERLEREKQLLRQEKPGLRSPASIQEEESKKRLRLVR